MKQPASISIYWETEHEKLSPAIGKCSSTGKKEVGTNN
jgi:hypothetical protein